MKKIICADDEADIAELLKASLEFEGYEVRTVKNGLAAVEEIAEAEKSEKPYDLAILDIMMAPLGGLETLKELRRKKIETPVIFLTAKDFVYNKVEGLNLGADDYITKPFSLDELVARIETVLRRSSKPEVDKKVKEIEILKNGKLELNSITKDVKFDNELLHFTPTEFELLEYLTLNAGTIVSKEGLADYIWANTLESNLALIEVYVSTVRKKLKEAGLKNYIETKRGFGYLVRK